MEEMTLREIQLAELDILIEFDKICKENDLKYSLCGGTMLGAIRHKGFIPWDDDIDVMMPRPDYERLKSLFNDINKQDNLQLLTKGKNKEDYPFMKLIDKRYVINCPNGDLSDNLWIDIFPVDGFPTEKEEAFLKRVKKYRSLFVYNYYTWKSDSAFKNLLIKLYGVYAKAYGMDRALKKLNKLALCYDYLTSEYAGVISWGLYGVGEKVVKNEFENIVEVDFEGHKLSAMSCWDDYLHGIYGDYMQLPPENKRATHSFVAYKQV